MNTMNEENTGRLGQVTETQEKLAAITDVLLNDAKRLYKRLQPVMRSEPATSEGTGDKPASLCPLADLLRASVQVLSEAHDLLCDIEYRLEV